MRRLSGKGISCAHSCWRVMRDIARNDFKIVNQRRRGDLLIEWIFGIGDAKTAPNVRRLLVEGKDSIGVCGCHSHQPLLEPVRLRLVAPMANSLDSFAGLADHVGVDQVHVSACGRLFLTAGVRSEPSSLKHKQHGTVGKSRCRQNGKSQHCQPDPSIS